MHLTKYLQSAFTLRTRAGAVFGVDFGSETPPDTVLSLGHLTAVFVSHRHPDHLHVEHLRVIGTDVYGPQDVISELNQLAIPTHPLMPGDCITVDGLEVRAYLSNHGPGLSAPIDNLALSFHVDGKHVLYLGDMAVSSPIPDRIWDAVLIPVGGSKVFTPEAALAFITDLGHTGLTIPIHYHGRADRAAGQTFARLASNRCSVRELAAGEAVEV